MAGSNNITFAPSLLQSRENPVIPTSSTSFTVTKKITFENATAPGFVLKEAKMKLDANVITLIWQKQGFGAKEDSFFEIAQNLKKLGEQDICISPPVLACVSVQSDQKQYAEYMEQEKENNTQIMKTLMQLNKQARIKSRTEYSTKIDAIAFYNTLMLQMSNQDTTTFFVFLKKFESIEVLLQKIKSTGDPIQKQKKMNNLFNSAQALLKNMDRAWEKQGQLLHFNMKLKNLLVDNKRDGCLVVNGWQNGRGDGRGCSELGKTIYALAKHIRSRHDNEETQYHVPFVYLFFLKSMSLLYQSYCSDKKANLDDTKAFIRKIEEYTNQALQVDLKLKSKIAKNGIKQDGSNYQHKVSYAFFSRVEPEMKPKTSEFKKMMAELLSGDEKQGLNEENFDLFVYFLKIFAEIIYDSTDPRNWHKLFTKYSLCAHIKYCCNLIDPDGLNEATEKSESELLNTIPNFDTPPKLSEPHPQHNQDFMDIFDVTVVVHYQNIAKPPSSFIIKYKNSMKDTAIQKDTVQELSLNLDSHENEESFVLRWKVKDQTERQTILKQDELLEILTRDLERLANENKLILMQDGKWMCYKTLH